MSKETPKILTSEEIIQHRFRNVLKLYGTEVKPSLKQLLLGSGMEQYVYWRLNVPMKFDGSEVMAQITSRDPVHSNPVIINVPELGRKVTFITRSFDYPTELTDNDFEFCKQVLNATNRLEYRRRKWQKRRDLLREMCDN